MPDGIVDYDVKLLAGAAANLETQYVRKGVDDPWAGSPFAWIHGGPSSRQKGKIGEQLVAAWCEARKISVDRTGDTEADLLIGGQRFEVKFSTLWESGVYTFQQFRDQDYKYAICLGLSPFMAHCWVVSKTLLKKHVIGHTPQHRGGAGTDTFWLSFHASEPPEWLHPCGGTLAQAYAVLRRAIAAR